MKTREVTITVNEPEPGDPLPFVALAHKGVTVAYYEHRYGALVTPEGEYVSDELAGVLGLAIKVAVNAVVGGSK